jgi:hypothetical protein
MPPAQPLDPEWVHHELNNLRIAALIARADMHAALMAMEELGKKLGTDTIDGLTIREWHGKARVEALEHEFIQMEDLDPELAAALQAHLDDVKRRNGLEDPPEE